MPGSRWWARKRVWIPTVLLVGCGLLYAGDLLLAGDDIPRNTTVGGVLIGGQSHSDAAALLEEDLSTSVSAPRDVSAGDATGAINSAAAGIELDVAATVEDAARQPLNPLTRFLSLFTEREVAPTLSVQDDLLDTAIAGFAATVDRPVVEGAITFDGIEPVAVDPVPGLELDRPAAAATFVAAVRADPALSNDEPVQLPVDEIPATITAEDVQQALDTIAGPALAAPILVSGPANSPMAGATVEIPVTAIAAALRFTPDEQGRLEAGIDPAALQAAMGAAFAPFTTPGQDARFEIVSGAMTIVPSVDGTGMDMTLLSEAMVGVLTEPAPRQVEATLGPAPAAFTTEAANALGITEVVSTFTTHYTSSASGSNIRTVAADVNGAIVLPGETFSLNGFTGPRTEADGYVPAGVIIDGEFQEAIGGGVSQFATTTFNAVFFAGLEDVFHKPHSYYISRYPPGREATVFYDSIDLVFRNDHPTGIYIETFWEPGSLTVTFWGTKQVDIESVSSERYNYRSPQRQEKPDDGKCVPSGGSDGFDITVTRVFHELGTGTVLRTEDFVTRYNAQPHVVCVPVQAPGNAPPTTPGLLPPDRSPAKQPRLLGSARRHAIRGIQPPNKPVRSLTGTLATRNGKVG
ncbi:MAG: VanW family protein [Actinomycetota bacterium]|nr:VanW family protein [Actinomycetota bacterium]